MTSLHHPTEVVKLPVQPPVTPIIELPRIPPPGLNASDSSASLSQLTKIVRKQKWKLLAFMALTMAIAVGVQFTIPKLYEGTAIVKVDRHSAPGILGQEAAQVSPVDDMDQIITTQMELAQSDPVLRPIAEKYNLLEKEHQLRGLSAEEIRRVKAAPIELKKLKVTRPPNTYLIRITYRAYDEPRLAADVANAIADSLIRHANDTNNRSYAEVSNLIGRHMVELRAKMDASAQSLAQYEKDLNMVDPEQRTTILTARLAQLNTEFTTAQADRVRKEAVANEIAKTNSLGAAQAVDAESSRSLVDEALERLDSMRQLFASARAYYGENHPEYRKAKEQLDEAQAEVDASKVDTKDKARAEYEQAFERESRLRNVLDETKAEADRLKASAIQYEQLKSEAENDRKTYEDLETRTREADVNDQFRDATAQLAVAARPAFEQIFPRLIIDLPIAFVLSIILGVLGAVLADALDNTFSDPEEVATQLHVDVLASIPAVRKLPHAAKALDPGIVSAEDSDKRSHRLSARYWEAIRTLRSTISMATLERPVRTVLMTSANPGEGKSTTSSHLALACAQIGKRVLLIDADLRRPTLHKQFGVSCHTGLSDVLTRETPVRDTITKIGDHDLFLMPAGPISRHAADLITIGFSSLLERLARDFDLVVVDGPPMLGLAETQELATFVDTVVLITKAGSTTGKAVSETLATLLRVRANILGIVMNHVSSSAGQGYGYYYYSKNSEREAAPQPASLAK